MDFLDRGVSGDELLIEVMQLPACVAQKQPSRDAVVDRAQVQKDEQHAAYDQRSVVPKQCDFVRRQVAQFSGQPTDDEEGRDGSGKCGVGNHRFVSSNAWSTRKYVICRPSGLTRMKP